MKSPLIFAALSLVALPASAVILTFDSAPYPVSGNPIDAPLDGWFTSEANIVDPIDGNFPFFYTSTGNGANMTTFATIGGVYATPDFSDYWAQRNFPVSPTLGVTEFNFEMNLADSFNDLSQGYDGTGIRNTFGFSLTTGPTSLLQVSFVPENQGGPVNSQNWAVLYKIGSGPLTASGHAIQPGSLTDMRVAFNLTGLDLSFGASSGFGPQPTFSGTIAGYNPFSITPITATFNFAQGDAGEYSNNTMSFDNIEVVPEPSALVLFGLSAVGLLRRHR
jgi:hypothetical protein